MQKAAICLAVPCTVQSCSVHPSCTLHCTVLTLTFDLELKIGSPVTPAQPWGTFTVILDFLCIFVFELGAHTGETCGQAEPIMLHKKLVSVRLYIVFCDTVNFRNFRSHNLTALYKSSSLLGLGLVLGLLVLCVVIWYNRVIQSGFCADTRTESVAEFCCYASDRSLSSWWERMTCWSRSCGVRRMISDSRMKLWWRN